MKMLNVCEAVQEAERFLKRAYKLQTMLPPESEFHWGCAETAAVRRASMDLTKALAKMRRER